MLELEKTERCCILGELMEEAEASWKRVLKRETIASLTEEIQSERFAGNTAELQSWINEKMVV